LRRVSEEEPRPIREINPEIPDWLCAIIGKLHAKRPDERFQSAKEVAELLERHLAHFQQPAPSPPATALEHGFPTVPQPPTEGLPGPTKKGDVRSEKWRGQETVPQPGQETVPQPEPDSRSLEARPRQRPVARSRLVPWLVAAAVLLLLGMCLCP